MESKSHFYMRSLHNLSIRAKILLITFPLLVGVFYLIFTRTVDSLNLSQSMNRLEKGVTLSTRISHLVHEIQKERGNSSGYLVSQSRGFRSQLDEQRILTDEQYEKYKAVVSDPGLTEIVAVNEEALRELGGFLEEIGQIRFEVDQIKLTSSQAIDRYTRINTFALNVLDQMIPMVEQSDVTREVQAYINFLKSKERAGIERAIGSQAFSMGTLDEGLYRRFSTLVAAQEAYLDAFLLTTNEEGKTFYKETMRGNALNEVVRMREVMYANGEMDVDPIYWFATITRKIELLKSVEDFLADRVVEKATRLAQEAHSEFWIFLILTLLMVLLDLIILFAVLKDLLGNLDLLLGFAHKIESGQLSERVTIEARDELGQLAGVLNKSITALDTAQKELNEEKNKAEYLYETNYKTSEVVFANVEQGVFLITPDLKISELYSQATESIFEQKDLAGKSLPDLLNPMLMPRDREALKVFSRQLFNSRVKDSVLTRLNPLNEVQLLSNAKNSGASNVKHIKVQFSRIVNQNLIEHVMVAVQDVTQEVLLLHKIRDNEESNRQEIAQLLSIIKVNPVLLKQYLERASAGLNDIYERYETDKSKNFKNLLKYSLNIVDHLKETAVLIDFNLMEDRFCRIEERLIGLMDTEVSGGDFLQVLYEINEVKRMVMDMSNMIKEIADVNDHSFLQEEIDTNAKLINGFERVLKKLSKEFGKKAKLIFNNPDEVIFPERIRLPLNDLMVQLLKNSMAHGIELPEERLRKGKPETGSIILSVEQASNGNLFISYSDDGRGLNEDKIVLEAQKKGLIEEAEEITHADWEKAREVVFEEDFSTTDTSFDYAGRGRGMSIVKSTLENIRGTYEIRPSEKEGFTFSFSVPVHEQAVTQMVVQ